MQKEEDNVVFVLQKAIQHFGLKVTNPTVKEYLVSHPDYPSLKSVCDALCKWNIRHYPVRLEHYELLSLKIPFIAHLDVLDGLFVFVEKIEKDIVTYYYTPHKVVKESYGVFIRKFSGATLILESSPESGEKEFTQNHQNEILSKSLLPVTILTIFIMLISNFIYTQNISLIINNYTNIGLVATKLIGLLASILLVLHEMKIHNPFTQKVCHFNSNFDCDVVLNSNASRLFGWINWADIGLIYFVGSLLYISIIQEQNNLWILSVLSLFALPYALFSIYYQSFRLKKWCPFCLSVQVILITEFILLYPTLISPSFLWIDILKLSSLLLVPASLWLILKKHTFVVGEKLNERISFLQLKRIPEVFTYLLKKGGFVEFQEGEELFVFGNPNGKITITAIISLHCQPCALVFNQLSDLLDQNPEIKLHIIFSVDLDENSQELVSKIYNLYKNKDENSTFEFLKEWYSTLNPSRMSLYKDLFLEDIEITEKTGYQSEELFEKFNVLSTPKVFIDGYKFPSQYQLRDIEFFLEFIVEEESTNSSIYV